MSAAIPDPWYPAAEDYYFGDDADVPVRQGDVFGSDTAPQNWHGFLITHPSCEVQAQKAAHVQVARLRPVSDLADAFQQAAVTYGFSEKAGVVRIAFAHTFWLPPAGGVLAEPMFADFRDVASLPTTSVDRPQRAAALSHDGRVSLIRRMIYHRFRWNLPLDRVRDLERARINADPAFAGPRPAWA